MKHTILFLLLTLILASCHTTKPGYAYTIGESPEVSPWYGSYISYGKDVFEYALLSSGSNTFIMQDSVRQTEGKHRTDTTGIYYLDATRRQFVLFRGLYDTASILNRGPFSAKKNGLSLADSSARTSTKISYSNMRDTAVSGVRLTYATIPVEQADSLTLILYYLSKKDLVTIYDLVPYHRPSEDHHCVGMDVLVHGKPAPEMHAILGSLRPLSKAERRTCAKLRKRAQASL